MGFFKSCQHWSFIIFSTLFLIVGGVFITLGTLYRVKFSEINNAIPPSCPYFELIPILTIVLGSIISFITILGFLGFFKRSSCLLSANTFALLIIFILQIGLGIFTFVEISHQNNLQVRVNKTVEDLFNASKNMEAVNFIQNELKCCGTYGPNFWKWANKTIPESCYHREESRKLVYVSGCQTQVQSYLIDTVRIIGITVLALSVFQVIVAILSMSLANTIRDNLRRYGRYMK